MNSVLQLIVWVFRLGVGGLFIFSGLIKANDPLGFSYKLKEYFEEFAKIFVEHGPAFLAHPMEWMGAIALPMAMFIVVLEIVLGVLTILGVKMKAVTNLLMLLIVFFTFLTFVSWKYEIVKTCGCFGDFWVLSPFESFLKDLILLVAILVLFVFRTTIETMLTPIGEKLAIWSSSIVFFLFTFYCFRHLPVADHRAYAIGESLLENMKVKKGNPLMLYKLQNKSNKVVVEMADFPDDFQNWATYIEPGDSSAKYFRDVDDEVNVKFIEIKSTGQKTRVLEIPEEFKSDWIVYKDTVMHCFPDKDPKIMNFSAEDDQGIDHMPEFLADSNYRFILSVRSLDFYGDYEDTDGGKVFMKSAKGEKSYKQIQDLFVAASAEGMNYNILTNESDYDKIQAFQHEMDTRVKFYNCGDVELKTLIRSSPGLLLLKKDTVIGKWHYNDLPTFEEIQEDYIN